MRRYVVTRLRDRILTAEYEDGRCVGLIPEEEQEGSRIGSIYVGRVQKIVKNIRAAFVEFEPGVIGYYPLSEEELSSVKAGQLLPVQVERDAVKTKEPVLTGRLSFPGRFAAVVTGKEVIGVSSKIRDESFRAEVREKLAALCPPGMGIIVRTAAHEAPMDAVLEEAGRLFRLAGDTVKKAGTRTAFSLLYGGEPYYVKAIRDAGGRYDEIVTDLPECHERLEEYLREEEPEHGSLLHLYGDEMISLPAVCRLERDLEEALSRLVWLPSGGNIVIEPTEALTVIDVNTARYSGHKKASESVLRVNLEAAEEIARQLRLRNLSGIIVVDFINMESQESTRHLMDRLAELLSADPVKCVPVDMTPLGLCEITRKKIRRPLAESMR